MAARTGREALAMAASQPPPDAVILDFFFKQKAAYEIIGRLRRWYQGPIIVLSGRTGPGDKISALDVGADDYGTKPFAMPEPLARLRATLRRRQRNTAGEHPRPATIGHRRSGLATRQRTPPHS